MYLYVLTAHTLSSVRLSVNHSDGFKDDPDGIVAIKKSLVHQGRESKNTSNIHVRELWTTVIREDLQKAGKGCLGGMLGKGFME